MSTPFKTHAVKANAAASETQRTSRRASVLGECEWWRAVVSMRLLSAELFDVAATLRVVVERAHERSDRDDVDDDRGERPDRKCGDEGELDDRIQHQEKHADRAGPRLVREDPEPDENLDDAEDEEERSPGRVVGEEQPAFRDREVVVLQEGNEPLEEIERADDENERAGERVPTARELASRRPVVLSLRRHLFLLWRLRSVAGEILRTGPAVNLARRARSPG